MLRGLRALFLVMRVSIRLSVAPVARAIRCYRRRCTRLLGRENE